MLKEWESFQGGIWEKEINVRDFIQKNYVPYDGDDTFLQGPTQATQDLWQQVMDLTKQEREKGRCPGYGYQSNLHHYFSWSRLP